MAEGGGLLNRYRVKSSIGGSNPPLSASKFVFKHRSHQLRSHEAEPLIRKSFFDSSPRALSWKIGRIRGFSAFFNSQADCAILARNIFWNSEVP